MTARSAEATVIESSGDRRIFITGIGILTPHGSGIEAFWEGLAKPVEAQVVRTIPQFSPEDYSIGHVEARRLDRFAQFGVGAAAQALVDAGLMPDVTHTGSLDGCVPERVAIVMGTGIGGAMSWEPAAFTHRDRGARFVSPLLVPKAMPNSAAAAMSMRWKVGGPCETVATACASGTHAIGAAARLIASGRADVVVTGGAEACLNGTNIAGFTNMRALSTTGISRPFDIGRDGFCASEGAGMLVLESAGHARARGVRTYAEVAGIGSTADAYHITAPEPAATGAVRCIRLALADAGIDPAEVTHVNAHGTSTPFNDAAEALAIRTVFGSTAPAVTSIKGVTGHALGAAGAIEAVAVALSFARRSLPPTMGTEQIDPALDIDVVLQTRPWSPGPVISNSFAFGGHNGTLVFLPADD